MTCSYEVSESAITLTAESGIYADLNSSNALRSEEKIRGEIFSLSWLAVARLKSLFLHFKRNNFEKELRFSNFIFTKIALLLQN